MVLNNRRSFILFVLLIVVAIFASIYTTIDKRGLKNEIRDNIKRADSIELLKDQYFERIKVDSVKIRRKDSLIIIYRTREAQLLDSIRKNNYEFKNARALYLNSDRDQRVRIFAELANKAD